MLTRNALHGSILAETTRTGTGRWRPSSSPRRARRPASTVASARPPMLRPMPPQHRRAMYHTLSRVKSGGGAAYPLAVAGLIAGTDTSLFNAFSCPSTSPSTFDKLRYIERRPLGRERRLGLGPRGPPARPRLDRGRGAWSIACQEDRRRTPYKTRAHAFKLRAQAPWTRINAV